MRKAVMIPPCRALFAAVGRTLHSERRNTGFGDAVSPATIGRCTFDPVCSRTLVESFLTIGSGICGEGTVSG